jgi:hypothetical protein
MGVPDRDEDMRLAAILVRRALQMCAEADLEPEILDALLDALRLLSPAIDGDVAPGETPASGPV